MRTIRNAQPKTLRLELATGTSAPITTVTLPRASAGVIVRASRANSTSASVYIGAIGMTSSNGFTLVPGDAVELDCDDPSEIYGLASVSGQYVEVIYL